jgi:hypothetical protein
VREALLQLMFTLHKRPTPAQAGVLVDACAAIAGDVGVERTEEELFAQIATQLQHKDAERRLFAVRAVAAVTPAMRPRERAKRALAALSRLLNDPYAHCDAAARARC